MEIKRKCKGCGKELGLLEGSIISRSFPASSSFNMPSGGVDRYCDKCYKKAISNR